MRVRILHIIEDPFLFLRDKITASAHPQLKSYILALRILYFVHSFIFVSPIHLVYDEISNRYLLRPCHPIQRAICFAILCLTSLSIVNNLRIASHVLLSDTTYIVAFFDWLNIFVLNCFIYIHMHLHWNRVDVLNSWVTKLQTSPVVQYCTLPIWKAKLFATGVSCTSIYIAVVWTLTMFDLEFNGVPLLYERSGPVARQLFFMNEFGSGRVDGSDVGFVWRVLTIISRLYDAIYIHVTLNAFIPIHSFCYYNLAKNFFNAILHKKIPRNEVLKLYEEYKSVLAIINSFFGPYCFHFLGTTLCFHSVHLLDALNTSNKTWKINMYIYIVYLLSFFGFPTKTLMAGRKIKRWLWQNQNYIEISDGDLKSILYDRTNDRLGIFGSKFFIVSPNFTGTIYQALLKFSLLNLEHTKMIKVVQPDTK